MTDPELAASFRTVSRALGLLTAFGGALVLIGWLLDVEPLKRIAPSLVAMNPATATAFVFLGTALFGLHSDGPARRAAAPCAAAGGAIGALKLVQFLGVPVRVDELLFAAKLGAETADPNRMAPNTAFVVVALSASAATVDRRPILGQALATVAAVPAWFALVGYVLATEAFYGLSGFIPMALHTAMLALAAVLGLLLARPEAGAARWLADDGPAGLTARRLIPTAIVVPIALGWLRLRGQLAGLYPNETGIALMAAFCAAALLGATIWCARLLEGLERGRRAAVERIEALNRELESGVAELTAANRDLDSFCHSVSHDLRGPLRAIDGFARIIVEDYGSRLDDEGRRLLSVVCDNAAKMGQLIDDLLSFARLGRQSLSCGPVDMSELSRSVTDELGDAAGHARIVVGNLPAARCDRALARQVLLNLLSNAAKFTRDRQDALIEVSGALGRDGFNVYKVKDNGAGFDMRYKHKLFKIFQRLHADVDFKGTGVGLSIVHRIIERHGGRIWAEGEPGKGAEFSFELPALDINKGART